MIGGRNSMKPELMPISPLLSTAAKGETTTTSPTGKSKKKRKPRSKNNKRRQSKMPDLVETWRVYGLKVHPDDLTQDDDENKSVFDQKRDAADGEPKAPIPKALEDILLKKLKVSELPPNTNLVRRSLDARKKLEHPTFQYVVDVPLTRQDSYKLGWKNRPGRTEILEIQAKNETASTSDESSSASNEKKQVIVVGTGPCGLFCALQLALEGVKPILIDRGEPVERRGRDIGALIHRRNMNPESNFAFGEGGAGTWSDGKLTTRTGRNSESVRWILEKLVEYGAPSNILWEGAPHLGTDNLVKLLRKMREHLKELGGEIHFGTRMSNLILEDGVVKGVQVEDEQGSRTIFADATVLATGHSARDVYESLNSCGVQLEAKGFAVGFRIEHPQKFINKIQYGNEWGLAVKTGKSTTDEVNLEHFGGTPSEHEGKLPVPSYRLATDKAEDGTGNYRGVYSFCMCPGGQIVPASTNSSEVCVNGMSFSRRDSLWANSALVVTVAPDDPVLEPYREQYGVLAGLEFQRDMERRAAILGGGNLTVPVQRVTDFCEGQVSETIPSSSYRLGVQSAPCHELYPEPITRALTNALTNQFSDSMPGYFHPDGLLHAVETRTSSPMRISRDAETLQAIGCDGLFPAGEGAGFAGGIVSAAVDGVNVAGAVMDKLEGTSSRTGQRSKSVGFSY
ncbi:unnamed protein product [Cylindrotheca closterium]|uniref:FAD-binding domain-containing protein n=1 Tax=Cylindrotheca closterium TaxID=2856 RepID=A0AAD2FZ33_9STRA|nr:unnamed protein product [Cylindrotheca closterium]